jgi:hypothetical protein
MCFPNQALIRRTGTRGGVTSSFRGGNDGHISTLLDRAGLEGAHIYAHAGQVGTSIDDFPGA